MRLYWPKAEVRDPLGATKCRRAPFVSSHDGGSPAVKVRSGSCVTSVAGPNGDAQLYER
jgi:hypothetical protein